MTQLLKDIIILLDRAKTGEGQTPTPGYEDG